MRESILKQLWKASAASVVFAIVLAANPAPAMTVYDPTNYAQNLLQAARALEQIHNQIQQIEQQARMLTKNPLQLSPELSESIGAARELFDAAKGIAFEMDKVSEDLRTLYPETWDDFDLDQVSTRTDQWLKQDRIALERSLRAEAQAAQSIGGVQARIDKALKSSADADGQTGATQASNQLLGINASQLAQIQALLASQSRVLTTERLERVAREERAREIQRRAFPVDAGAPGAPARSSF
jgi:P-type conjugative transfer protein TrbJ